MYNLEEMISRIKKLKKDKKLSNDMLSSLSGVPKGTLAKILGSETKDPQISNIIKISQALGVSADYVIFGKEDPKRDDEFLKLFSSLNADGQSKVVEYMRDLINSGNYHSYSPVSEEQKIHTIYRAANSKENSKHTIEQRSESTMRRLADAPKVKKEEDL